jgi:hypothetical protein
MTRMSSGDRSALQVAREYHRAWERRDFEFAERLLSDDLAIDVPINRYDSKAAFMEAAVMTREMASGVTSFADFGGEHDAVLLYDMELPIGSLRVAEYFGVSERGLINRIVHVHDTAALRAAGMG